LIDAALAMGFAGYATKPVDLANVQATAQARLARKG
jgi:DNA-binding response OmpR family regulator